MKILILIAVILTAVSPYKNSSPVRAEGGTTGNATAKKMQGVEVFVYSEPVQDYEVIESGKVVATLSGSCTEVINQAVKKAAKLNAQGVIIHLESSKWDAIKFKP